MNRQIKFRGKRTDNGEWVYGYYVAAGENHYIFTGKTGLSQVTSAHKLVYMDFAKFEVTPETFGQFTGLYDATRREDLTEDERDRWTLDGNFPSEWKGKEIYEGDILRGLEYPYFNGEKFNYYAEVVWFDNVPAFGISCFRSPDSAVSGISAGNAEIMEDWEPEKWEVIGNIHDNKDLLTAKE